MVEHHDLEIPWHRHPVPARRHQCWAASTYDTATGIMQRCPCGAARHMIVLGTPVHIGRWQGRNARRTAPENRRTYRRPRVLDLIRKVVPR